MELLETIKTLDTPSALRTLADHDVRAFGSPKMAAIVEHALRNWDDRYESQVTPAITPVVTSDGFVISDHGFLGTAQEVEENWESMLMHFDLDIVPFPWKTDWRVL
jgi:hypothetical protein